MAFGANKGTWLFGANSIVANNQATLSTGSAVVAKGDLIVVVIGEVVANTSSGATDTLGNTYTAITAGTLVGATVSGRAFYTIVTNPGTNTNINVQATASSNNVAIVAASYEGSFSAIDKQPANNNNTDNSSPFTCPATGTLAQQLELIVAWMVDNTANVKTATSPNIKANQQSQVTVSSVLGHQVVNVTTTVSPAFTGTNPTASIQGTASFRAADLPAGEVAVSFPITLIQSGSWRAFRTFTSAPNPNLAVTAGPFNQEDWPLPVISYYPNQLRVWSVRGPAYEVIVPPPPADTATVRAPHFSRPRLPEPLLYDVPRNLTTLLASKQPFNQFDWPVARRLEPHIGLRAWAGAIPAPMQLITPQPIGKTAIDLPAAAQQYHISLRSWAGVQFRQQVVAAPIGQILLAPVRGYEHHFQLRVWSVSGPKFIVAAARTGPFNQFDWPVPLGYEFSISLRSWTTLPRPVAVVVVAETAVFREPHFERQRAPAPLLSTQPLRPLTLFAAPVQIPFSQSDWQLTGAIRQPQRSWTASYNLNLIGQDKLPTGKIITDRPVLASIRVTDLGTWISQTKLLLAVPFGQSDWPLPRGPLLPQRSWTWSYNLNLIGKDALPTGEIISDLPPQPALSAIQLRTWIQSVNLALTTQAAVLPNNQSDWPIRLPPTPQARTFIGFYNLNLIGKDRLPINQSDWPLPRAHLVPQRSWTASYNLNLIGKDQLPVGEINTSLPVQQRIALQTWINAVNLALTSVQALPFNQSNWPINTGPRQPDRSYGHVFSRVLIGQDRLPFRQQDWPIWRDHQRAPPSFTAFYNRNLIGKDRLPFRQQDWPLPRDPRRLADWVNRTDPNLFIPGPAPPPPRSPSHRDVSLALEATRFAEAEQIRPDNQQPRRPAAPRSTRSNVQDPGIRR